MNPANKNKKSLVVVTHNAEISDDDSESDNSDNIPDVTMNSEDGDDKGYNSEDSYSEDHSGTDEEDEDISENDGDGLLLRGDESSDNETEQEDSVDKIKKTNKSTDKCKQNATESDGRTKQQIGLANVMGNLLKKGKADAEPLSESKKGKDIVATENKQLRKKRRRDDKPMQIVGKDGKVLKLEPKENKSANQEDEQPNRRRFPMSRRLDPYCQDPKTETDAVKEKKLRTLATQGVVQLFNTLEEYRRQSLEQQQHDDGRNRRQAKTEVSAIMTDKGGLINFLSKKGGKGADRQLFGEGKTKGTA